MSITKEQVTQALDSLTEGQLELAFYFLQQLQTQSAAHWEFLGSLIAQSPEICGNRPHLAGTQITVGQVATLWKWGQTPEEIVEILSDLTLAQVYGALAYYHRNRMEIEDQISQDEVMSSFDPNLERYAVSGEEWPPGFFEEVIGGWEGEKLTRSPQPDYPVREELR